MFIVPYTRKSRIKKPNATHSLISEPHLKKSFLFNLILGTSAAELEVDDFPCQFSVHFSESVYLIINDALLLRVQVHLVNLGSINLGAEALSDNLGWENKILEERVMHGGKSAGSGPLLGDAGPSGWERENSAKGKEDNVSVRELLLKLTGQTLLDLLEALQ